MSMDLRELICLSGALQSSLSLKGLKSVYLGSASVSYSLMRAISGSGFIAIRFLAVVRVLRGY